MYYSIVGTDRENSLEARLKVRSEHIKRIEELRDSGRLLLAGPNPAIDSEDPGPTGFSGSLNVAEFQDLDAAREWAEQDPYTLTGVFSDVVVKPFKKVLP
jgi:uncharacterized protein YciI